MALKPSSSKYFFLLVTSVIFISQSVSGQFGRRSSGGSSSWEIGISGGVSKFLTSIDPNKDALYKKFNYWNANFSPTITLSVSKTISPKFSAELELFTTKLTGVWNQNNGYPIPPLATAIGQIPLNPFKTGIKQFEVILIPNLNQIVAPNRASDKWFLYAKVGFGLAFLREYSALYPLIMPDNLFKYTIIFGGGLSYSINDKFKLKLGTNWYRVETDRIDGIHTLKTGGNYLYDSGYAYNIKERYIYPYLGISYGLGKITTSSKFIQKSSKRSSSWFAPSKKKYKRRR